MSEYQSFLFDFPARCNKLLEILENNKRGRYFNVTAYLSLFGYSALVVHEIVSEKNIIRSERGNEKNFSKKYYELMEEKFVESVLCKAEFASEWMAIKGLNIKPNTLGDVLVSGDLKWKRVSSDKTVKNVIDTVRNSLAHANTYLEGSPHVNVITFASVRSNKESVNENNDEIKIQLLQCPVEAFKSLAYEWFEFVDANSKRL